MAQRRTSSLGRGYVYEFVVVELCKFFPNARSTVDFFSCTFDTDGVYPEILSINCWVCHRNMHCILKTAPGLTRCYTQNIDVLELHSDLTSLCEDNVCFLHGRIPSPSTLTAQSIVDSICFIGQTVDIPHLVSGRPMVADLSLRVRPHESFNWMNWKISTRECGFEKVISSVSSKSEACEWWTSWKGTDNNIFHCLQRYF